MKALDNLQIQIDIFSWTTYRAKATGQTANLKSKDNKWCHTILFDVM